MNTEPSRLHGFAVQLEKLSLCTVISLQLKTPALIFFFLNVFFCFLSRFFIFFFFVWLLDFAFLVGSIDIDGPPADERKTK